MTKYRALLADPPWMLKGGTSGKSGWSSSASPDAHYPLLTTDAIKRLPVQDLAADDSFLFLWVVNGLLPQGLEVMSAWGYRYVNNFCWRKTTGFGIGQYIRGDHELCLFGIRGRPGYKKDTSGKRCQQPRSVIEAPRTGHSVKPEEIHRRVAMITEGPYLELFARKRVVGWDVWGNEVTPDVQIQIPEEAEVA